MMTSWDYYWDFKEELAVHDGVVFKKDKVVIPTSLRVFMMKKAHQPHLGIEASKRRARELMYWPGINNDIERMVKTCEVCNSNKKQQQKEPLQPHPVPNRPFQRIGADLLEFEQQQYLITADFYSGWFEIDLLPSQKTSTVVQKLKALCLAMELQILWSPITDRSLTTTNSSSFKRNGVFNTSLVHRVILKAMAV